MSELGASILLGEREIARRVEELAAEISNDYADKTPLVLIGILKGSFIFLADLSRRLTIPRTVEFIAVSSYDGGSLSTGAVRMIMDVRESIENKHVLVVEDIVDSGHTLHYLLGMLRTRNPASIKTCALLQKSGRTQVDVNVDYAGFNIANEWVVGYGLDYAEKDRTLPYIGTIDIRNK